MFVLDAVFLFLSRVQLSFLSTGPASETFANDEGNEPESEDSFSFVSLQNTHKKAEYVISGKFEGHRSVGLFWVLVSGRR